MGHPASRVALFPLTGRRHQLRVHCLHAGFPIIGDGSYCRMPPPADAHACAADALQVPVVPVVDADGASAVDLSDVRMMLHAHALTFEVPAAEKRAKKKQRLLDSITIQSAAWVAPDPFESVLWQSSMPTAAPASFLEKMGAGCKIIAAATQEQLDLVASFTH